MSLKSRGIDPYGQRTSQLLQDAFGKFVQQKGFQDLTIQDITEYAGVNRAIFYAHFADKYALRDYVIQQEFSELLASRLSTSSVFNTNNLKIGHSYL